MPKYGAKRNMLMLWFQTSCNFDVTITNAILKPEDLTRISESASDDEKIKNKRHCNKFSWSSSLICVLTIYSSTRTSTFYYINIYIYIYNIYIIKKLKSKQSICHLLFYIVLFIFCPYIKLTAFGCFQLISSNVINVR